MKDNPFIIEEFRGYYTEELCRGIYGCAGVVMILGGLIHLVGLVRGEPGSSLYVIGDYVLKALVIAVFGGGLAFILHCIWRYRIRKK
jgi:hypothetical protein